MKLAKIVGVVVFVYAGLVAALELAVWHFQPDMPGAVIITTTDEQGAATSRTLAGFNYNDRLYVSSNHWLRGWYYAAVKNPHVDVAIEGPPGAYIATRVEGAEAAALSDAYSMGFVLRLMCGFAPSRFLRLDPQPA